eukprot:2007598-Rhodomonas_salina.1
MSPATYSHKKSYNNTSIRLQTANTAASRAPVVLRWNRWIQLRSAVSEVTAERKLPAKVPAPLALLQPAPCTSSPPGGHIIMMSGYSLGFPHDFFEAALQYSHPLTDCSLTEMWVRFTEARLTFLQTLSASASQAKQCQALTTALSSAQSRVRQAEEAAAEARSKLTEAERALLEIQAETLDAEKEFGDVLEEIRSDMSSLTVRSQALRPSLRRRPACAVLDRQGRPPAASIRPPWCSV